jgi:hypothetical protein
MLKGKRHMKKVEGRKLEEIDECCLINAQSKKAFLFNRRVAEETQRTPDTLRYGAAQRTT